MGSDPRAPGIGSVFVLSFVRRMMSGAGAVRFLWFDYFWCESRISLGAIHEFLSLGVGLLPPSPWGTADRIRFLCSSPP